MLTDDLHYLPRALPGLPLFKNKWFCYKNRRFYVVSDGFG